MSKRHKEESSQKGTYFFIGFTVLFIALTVVFIRSSGSSPKDSSPNPSAVSESNGTQYIDITAKGGYTPNSITAKANTKTVLRVKTSSTFDCSSALVIPSLNYRNNLPPTAITEIDVPPQEANSVLRGSCAMGMYRFAINFN
jgi:plastocyanin domain-containing protein